MNARRTAGSAADQAAHSDALEHLARVGLIAYGVVHLLVAWLALQLAWGGGGGESADQSGALATLAESPVGGPLLWVVGLGLVALAAWQAAEVARWRHGWSSAGEERKKALWKSAKALAKAVVYGALGVLALRFATGGGRSSSDQQQQTAAGVLGWPGGQWIVGAAGLVVIGIGVHHVAKGVTKGFLKEIDTSRSDARATRLITRVGQIGYPGKGVALLLVGGLVTWAAISFDPQKAAGLDAALRTLQGAPYGGILLTVVALGIAAFGGFCLARARYPERR